MRTLAVALALWAGALGCTRGDAQTAASQPHAAKPGTLQLKPDSPELKYVKLEIVKP